MNRLLDITKAKKKYKVYSGERFVCEGYTHTELAKTLGVSKSTITLALKNNGLVDGRYRIEEVELSPAKRKSKEEQTIDYLYRHLKKYGNTVLNSDPSKYAERLKNDYGIEFNTRQVRDNVGKRGRPRYFYILEVDK